MKIDVRSGIWIPFLSYIMRAVGSADIVAMDFNQLKKNVIGRA